MKKQYTKFENANAILNGMDDICDEFVDGFVDAHNVPIDNNYMYDWLLRSIVDVCKFDHSVLYIACGTSGYMRLFNNIKRFVGIDFSKKMITASKKESKKYDINSDFHCTTFEEFQTDEKFDVVWMGPYGHYVPFTLDILKKAQNVLNKDGFVLCSTTDPMYKGLYGRLKEFMHCLLYKRTFKYDRVKNIESMIKEANLDIVLKLRMKATEGYSIFWIGKKTTDA